MWTWLKSFFRSPEREPVKPADRGEVFGLTAEQHDQLGELLRRNGMIT